MRSLSVTLLLMLAATAAVAEISDGFRVLTSESARRLRVLDERPRLPDATLLDAGASELGLHAGLAADGRVTLVDFIYTRCETLCTALGSEFQQLQRELVARGLQDRVRLLSISFDPAHDQPAVLAAHARRLRADAALWRFATVVDARQRAELLRSFGVVVIPDGRGGYVHNAAIHVVTADARLVRIHDLGAVAQVLHDAEALP